jgi:hypothetical protein
MPAKSDLIFHLSGGTSNLLPNASLGGPRSNSVISNNKNNLFDDITEEEFVPGFTDYRCLYLLNISTENWQNIEFYLDPQTVNIKIQLGIQSADDKQQLTVISQSGAIGGSFTVDFNGTEVQVDFDADINVWAANFQTALRSLDALSDVTVTGTYQPDTAHTGPHIFQYFTILFEGNDGNALQPLLILAENNLTANPGDSIDFDITKLNKGAPIDTEPIQLADDTEVPKNVVFQDTSETNTISLGTLWGGSAAPIWMKRIVLPGAEIKIDDGFNITLRGSTEVDFL